MNTENLPVCELLPPNEAAEVAELYSGSIKEFIRVGPKKYVLPKAYQTNSEKLYNFQVRPDDVWQVTFPRSGTMWSQEMIWLIIYNLDYETAKNVPITIRVHNLEINTYCDESTGQWEEDNKVQSNKMIDQMMSMLKVFRPAYLDSFKSPRFVHSHLPLSLIPNVLKSQCKVVYVARNPKDVLVSLYHFNKDFRSIEFNGDFSQFVDQFLNNRVLWSPYFEHVKEGWAQRNNPNCLFLFYEDMSEDLPAVIRRVSKFFEKSYTEEQISQLAEHLQFDNVKNNGSINFSIHSKVFYKTETFIRQGKSNAWHTEFTPEISEKVDKWIEENLKDSDLRFPTPKSN